MSRLLKKQASDDITSRILEQIPSFAQDSAAGDSYYDRLCEMLRQEVERCNGQELENLDASVTAAVDAIDNIVAALNLAKSALQRAEEDISDKR